MIELQDLFSRKLLMISGKGGTGKSLLAASLGMQAAAAGKRVLLVESAVCEQLAPLFGKQPVGHRELPLSQGIWGINLNPKLCFKEYVVDHLGLVQLYKRVFDHRVVKSFLDAIPGLGETMLLGRIFYTCQLRQPPPYDLVIFDAPAMGHFFNLLTTPDAILDSGLMGPLVKEVSRVKEFLADERKSGALLITIPAELVTSEIVEFIPRLTSQIPLAVLGLFINRYYDGEQTQPGALQAFKESCPELTPALSYLQAKVETRLADQRLLLERLADLGFNDRLGFIPELERVDEPLRQETVDRLLALLA